MPFYRSTQQDGRESASSQRRGPYSGSAASANASLIEIPYDSVRRWLNQPPHEDPWNPYPHRHDSAVHLSSRSYGMTSQRRLPVEDDAPRSLSVQASWAPSTFSGSPSYTVGRSENNASSTLRAMPVPVPRSRGGSKVAEPSSTPKPTVPPPLPCSICGQKFSGISARTDLARHVKRIHPTYVYLCDHCDEVFDNANARKKHIRRKHSRPLSTDSKSPTETSARPDTPTLKDSQYSTESSLGNTKPIAFNNEQENVEQALLSKHKLPHDADPSGHLTEDIVKLLHSQGILHDASQARNFLQWLQHLVADVDARHSQNPVSSGFDGVLRATRQILQTSGSRADVIHKTAWTATSKPSTVTTPRYAPPSGNSRNLKSAEPSKRSSSSGNGRQSGDPSSDRGNNGRIVYKTSSKTTTSVKKTIKCPIDDYFRRYSSLPTDWPWDYNLCGGFCGERLSDLGEHLTRKHQFGFSHQGTKGKKIRCQDCWFFVLTVEENDQFHGTDEQNKQVCPKRRQPRQDEQFTRACWQLLYRRLFPEEVEFPKCFNEEDGYEDLITYASGQPSIPLSSHDSTMSHGSMPFLDQCQINGTLMRLPEPQETFRHQPEDPSDQRWNNESNRNLHQTDLDSDNTRAAFHAISDFLRTRGLIPRDYLEHIYGADTDWMVQEASQKVQQMKGESYTKNADTKQGIENRTIARLGRDSSSHASFRDSGYHTRSSLNSSISNIQQAGQYEQGESAGATDPTMDGTINPSLLFLNNPATKQKAPVVVSFADGQKLPQDPNANPEWNNDDLYNSP